MKIHWFIFGIVWLIYGAFINDVNLKDYNVFHAGAQAVAIRGDFQLGRSSSPLLKDAGGYDAFTYNDRKLAAKQPGATLVGGVAYFLLYHLFGLDYEQDYYHTAALVTFLGS